MTDLDRSWSALKEAVAFAVDRIDNDADPLNDREAADGHQYVMHILAAVAQSSLLTLDPVRPAFMSMLEAVRHLGAAGPDIDYDVAAVEPGVRHRITGRRGGATYVGICIYAHSGERGASGIVDQVDLDDIVAADGSFTYEFSHPDAARVIVRQYFHDRSLQAHGAWTIERLDTVNTAGSEEARTTPTHTAARPTPQSVSARLANTAASIRWNAQLNQLWAPDLRATPNHFVRQTPQEIVAAVTNPDVIYSFSWWRVDEGQALVIDVTPPDTRYWSLQICDRWFQCYPDRRTNLNDQQVTPNADGSVQLVLSDGDPGHPNWLDTSGHRTGTMFFRWLHADPPVLPTCRLIPVSEL
jgi:hypothetical protein